MTPVIQISVDNAAWRRHKTLSRITRRAIQACIDEIGCELKQEAELSLLLCDDNKIRNLNKKWRGIDKATNVLSFPAIYTNCDKLLGDIVIAYGVVDREAVQEGKSFESHYLHLVVHGFLHLLGFDHEASDEAELMEKHERKILNRIGITDPYRQNGIPKVLNR